MQSEIESPPILSDRLKSYLNDGFEAVNGWCDVNLWNVIELFAKLHQEAGLDAAACEIGVHHGKFFLGLANTVRTRNKSLAIDLFEQQDLNIDLSGKGSLKKFLQNAADHADASLIETLAADSLSLGQAEIMKLCQQYGKFAFFSVDGGHTVEHTINDALIAMQLTAPGGIIFIDDYYNPSWPGVQEGIVRLYTLQTPNFVPLCYASGKLILTDISHHKTYYDALLHHLRDRYPNSRVKQVQRFGWNSLTVNPGRGSPAFSY